MQEFKYSWLLFDADGTLFDYNNAEETAIRKTFSQLGHEYYPEYLDAYKKINNQMWKAYECGGIHKNELKTQRFAILLEELKIKADHLMFSKNYLRNLS
ncbi:MAG: hypothetical protein P4L45_03475, partial [Ignavibacteriaceae bacterium]|nr:hypothetical protein [Ignavibacteriaceae bacterium]